VGRIDLKGESGRIIFEHAIAHKAGPVLRGYIRGMLYAGRFPSPDFLALMSKLESTQPELAIDILIYGGDSFDALNRILRLVDSQRVSARYLANLSMGLGGRKLNADEINRVLPYFTRAAAMGEAETALAGVRFLKTLLLFESRHSAETCLTSADIRSFAWQLIEGALPFLTQQRVSDWAEIVKKLAAFDADRATQLLAAGLLAENIGFRIEAERELIELAKDHPKSVLEAFGLALLNPKRGWVLQVDVYRELVGQIPQEIVLAWVRKHGVEGAKAIARHLPAPYLDVASNPIVPEILDTILREYDDDEVFASFLGGTHSGETWNGNGADQFRQTAEDAKKFLNDSNRRIREWAKSEIAYRLQMAEWEDREHEERFLPS
jgi:hypothetical protein